RARVQSNLTLPEYRLTTTQQRFASGQLATIRRLESGAVPGCGIDLRWELLSGTGSRRIG
ncbi:MAG TPA: hypothetical protein VHJ76_00580, partial [Actinomycetota bacterium]|nr:hypothetical protein [Actinomycetota bacterium]